MTVEDASNDNFPVGMRVLAVDDNPTCLKVLETLLRRCDYQVTTTNQAITALNLLMENKDKFDLVISDVHMPDMDGFKLLELVGLEMDIPVIMLSGNSDTKAVMRGITHGACDYLLKPVRIEELKNIWQHVVRRKKNDSKENGSHSHGNEGEKQSGTGEGGQTHEMVGANDSNGKLNRKRKDQNEEDDDDFDENSDDPATQKKPRVVWSVELHRKFVDAVNRLGIEKAVPKRILDLMNVEKLTRENVASHLQKYRLYLKRISNVTTEQANMAALLGGKDLGYLPMGSYDGLSDLQAFPGLSTLPKPTLSSFQAGGFAGQFNSPNNLGLCRLPSAGMIQLGHSHNSGNLMNNFGKLQQLPQAGSQHRNLLQGMPHSLELDQLQHIKLSSSLDDSTAFPIRQQQLTGVGCSNSTAIDSGSFGNDVHGASENSIMLRGLQLSTYNGGSLGNQASNRISHLNSEQFNVVTGLSSCPPDHTRLTGTWQNNIPIRGFSSDALPMVDGAFSNGEFFPQNVRDNISAIASQVENSSLDFSTGNVVSATMNSAAGDTKLLNFTNMQNNVGSSVNYAVNQKLDDHLTFQSASNSSIPYKNFGQTSGIQSENMVGSSFLAQNIGIAKPNNGDQKPKGGSPLEQTKLQGAFYPNNQANSFDDLMTLVRRRRV